MSSTSIPAPPPFSYAQAARGFQSGAASSQKSADVSAASSEKGARGRQSSPTDGEKLENRPKSSDPASAETASPSTMKPLEAPRTSSVGSKEVSEKDIAKESKFSGSSEESKTMMSPTTVSLAESEALGNHKDEEVSIGPNGISDAWDRQSDVSTSVEKGNAVNEKEKQQAGDDDWEKVSVPSLSQERELKAAPPPTVNIWQQRKQAQEAKQREQASQRPVSSAGKAATASGPVADSAKTKSGEKLLGAQDREGGPKRKPVDATKITTEKSGQTQPAQGRPSSRGQQPASNLPPPPPVGDAVAWPTPDTATEADDRRKPSVETNDKFEVKPSGAKQPKKWTQVPFVPTAVFNTPLPPAAAKRGGRGGIRGGRDGTGRGGHMAQNSVGGDKSDLGASMGPPPVPRQGEQDRGRRPDASRGGRATSVPTHRRRSASTATTQVESRKASGTGAGPAPGEGLASGNAQESRSSSRPTDASSRANPNANIDSPDPSLASENTHAHPTVDPIARTSIPPEWFGGKAAGGGVKPTGEQSTKERSQPRTRTFQESRDKVESWRDRDPQAEASIRRESRNERGDRGGRGTYRGRGNNAGYVPASSQHAYTAPLPQQPFAPHKSQSYNDSRQRQSSQPYPIQPVSVGGRPNLRSQSIPMPPLSPIQTDVSGMYGYYPGQMLPGIMGPIPHNSALDVYGLMALVVAQL
jgi:la-related protein 1